ncbi:hypothetical protein N658DRAFT_554022 [Parathielavia hyrcaniae]|uniref:C2 NT-type domain-containing protein n=1 Tax=Parathielavia hyrcaniae TaxID=113614 RepID=A0AAN6Q2A5_9PEZI|nr:hypothetical protein N658DRAFT_554022 [Parathielavia hyrcaniae]
MQFFPLVHKARKPKFDVHLKISDLNNVPLVSGASMIKWHLPHSIHGEHRGRTPKCPILNHRVEYHYSKVIPVRIGIDRNNNLAECLIEFEVVQEFGAEKITLGTIRLNLAEYVEESEAVLRHGTSANAANDTLTSSAQIPGHHHRNRSSLSNVVPAPVPEASPRTSRDEERPTTSDVVQDGVVRRYLMQDSKINSTLKVSILMVQVEGERNYTAPAPKSAPVFGGIAGFVASDAAFEPVDPGAAAAPGHVPSSFSGKSRDVFEVQDMYRRALAASWASQPAELPADQCIEDIFAGGEGFAAQPLLSSSKKLHARGHSKQQQHHHTAAAAHSLGRRGASNQVIVEPDDDDASAHHHHLHLHHHPTRSRNPPRDDSGGSVSDDEENSNGGGDMMGTLRPRDLARMRRHHHPQHHHQHHHNHHHLRDQSVASDRSTTTVLGADRDRGTAISGNGSGNSGGVPSSSLLREPFPSSSSSSSFPHQHRREESKITHDGGGLRSRSSSLVSLATTLGTGSSERERGRHGEGGGLKRAREVDEFEVRDDLVAWSISGGRL